MSGPLDMAAVLADLQQQVTDVTGIVEAQQATLRDLNVLVKQIIARPVLASAVSLEHGGA